MEAGRRALDISMRAIDAYKKTLLVDKVTSDDEMSPPVYTLNEISDILMSCSLELSKEIVEYTFRRLRHRSPLVKCKVLRLINYTVNRAGSSAYRRELQSRSFAIRELFSYQGPFDPLKGDALNQAVRHAAQEAVKAIFLSDVSFNGKNVRIEGFGSGSFSYRSSGFDERERESFHDRDVNGRFHYGNVTSSFNSPNGKKDEMEREGVDLCTGNESFGSPGSPLSPSCKQDEKGETWNSETRGPIRGHTFIHSDKVVSLEDRLVNNITAPKGTRLRPSEESLQSFLSSANTLDAIRIGSALKAKLQAPSWQVRLRAVCVLLAVLRQKDADLLQAIEANKGDFEGYVRECLQSSQTTLRREAKKACDLLLALKEEKMHGRSPNHLVNDLLCDKPFLTTEVDKKAHTFAGSSSAPPAVKSQHEVVDLLSFQMGYLTCDQAADTSLNSVTNCIFDGMQIYESNDMAALHVKDLLSDGWISAHTDARFEYWPNVQNLSLSTPRVQSSAVQLSQLKTDVLDFNSLFDFTVNMSTSTGTCAASSLEGKQSNENTPGLQNRSALYMYPKGVHQA